MLKIYSWMFWTKITRRSCVFNSWIKQDYRFKVKNNINLFLIWRKESAVYLLRWTQMSACRQSGKPWHNIDIDIMILPLILLYSIIILTYLENHIHINPVGVGPGMLEVFLQTLFQRVGDLENIVMLIVMLHILSEHLFPDYCYVIVMLR